MVIINNILEILILMQHLEVLGVFIMFISPFITAFGILPLSCSAYLCPSFTKIFPLTWSSFSDLRCYA